MRTEVSCLSRSLDESGVTNDLANFARGRLQESPGTAITVGEGSVNVLAALDGDGVAIVIENLASEILLLNINTDAQLDGVEWSAGANRVLDLALKTGLVEGGLRGEIAVGQSNADIRVLVLFVDGAGAAFLEGRVADYLTDLGGSVLKGPLALVAIPEGDVDVLAADDDDRVEIVVEDLAAEVTLLDIRAQAEFDSCERAGGANGRLGLALALGELGLGANLQVLVLEDDSNGIVEVVGTTRRSSNGTGNGEG